MAQCLIVSHALTLMVHVDIQHVAAILAVKHMIMVYVALLVNTVQTVVAQLIMPTATLVVVAQQLTTGAMAAVLAQHQPAQQYAWA